ncbi:MAG: galactose ABC transporter substrate-binding protein [Desulfobulbaceae bacterium]|jgi:methyl-galactoside transport system substrate-binding protein|nr:galactose ABC transporter substrate-binding protein [Desulfobulbaceae bacterium]
MRHRFLALCPAARNVRVVLSSFAALALLLLITACDDGGQSESPAGDRPLVGLFLFNAKDTYIGAVSAALRPRLAATVELNVQDAQGDPILQLNQVDGFLSRQPKLLLVNAVDPKNAAAFVARAKKATIPIIFFNREPDLDVLRAYPKSCFVGTNAADAGRMQGELIAALWRAHPEYDRNRDGNCQYALFQGEPDNPEAQARSEYSVREAREKGVSMSQVGANLVCNWDSGLAERQMAALLASGASKEIEMVISNNDAMAMGVIAALNQGGYNLGEKSGPFIPVIGVDATEDAARAISDGKMSATVKQDGEAMAEAIVAVAENALAGKDFLAGTKYAWAADGISIRIPYSPFGEKESQSPRAKGH